MVRNPSTTPVLQIARLVTNTNIKTASLSTSSSSPQRLNQGLTSVSKGPLRTHHQQSRLINTNSTSNNNNGSSSSSTLPRNTKKTIIGITLATATILALYTYNRKNIHSEGRLTRLNDTVSPSENSSIVTRVFAWAISPTISSDSTTTTSSSTTREINPSTNLPYYTRLEVSQHTTKESGIWVTHNNGVYDITDFVDVHPGGERILLAAGTSIDPFWAIFSVHQSPETRSLLETYRIGDLLPIDRDSTSGQVKGADTQALARLFENDPERDPSLIVHSARPCNAEAPPENLISYITPNHLHFVRNHLPVPLIDESSYRLTIDLGNGTEVSYSLEDIKRKFAKVDVVVTLQCAGNRRKDMHDVKPVKGLQWRNGAISNAVWSGVKLRDVLKDAGVDTDPTVYDDGNNQSQIKHVQFDAVEGYGASIPVSKVMDPRGDVVLAYEMNHEPIPRDHGYPIRVVVPGHVAARSVKWLSKVTLSDEESWSHWQRRDYKGFGPSKDLEGSKYEESESIQEMPVQSAVLEPRSGETVVVDAEKKVVKVNGYAWSGGGRGIVRVDVSADGGRNWVDARIVERGLQPKGREWAWSKWEAELPVDTSKAVKGEDGGDVKVPLEVVCKAVDTSYNEQPEKIESVYNVRGVLVSAWHRVKVQGVLKKKSDGEQQKVEGCKDK
ncbi:hypothetical protein HDU76_001764 [Blyttiomyces sp. JEL0837]|nr:hypothetical protein HDU76_001764 [Blyttiomyces sp. JEL0837]